jgi:hexulose-6-phosphate isomerase
MQPVWSDDSLFDRRQWLKYGALLGSTLGGLVPPWQAAPAASATSSLQRSARQYGMRKSINLWAFPYPAKMTLQECFELARRAGFEAVEVNYNLEGDLSPECR